MTTTDERVSFLRDNPALIQVSRLALIHYREWQDSPKDQEWQETYLGFRYHDLGGGINPQETLQLQRNGILEVVHKASKGAAYYGVRYADGLQTILALLDAEREAIMTNQDDQGDFPRDFLSVIIGYDSAKNLVTRALEATRPVHILMIGPPASSKTVFLMELARLPSSEYHIGSSTSKAGLSSRLIEHKPRILLIDEMDKMDGDDQNVLLSLCENGIVKETKYQRHRQVDLKDTRVFAAANSLNFRPEIISRFQVLNFKPYNKMEFAEVVTELLHQREEIPPEVGSKIAQALWKRGMVTGRTRGQQYGPDPREAIRLARLMKEPTEKELSMVLDMLEEYQ